jgi:hypothetical protein
MSVCFHTLAAPGTRPSGKPRPPFVSWSLPRIPDTEGMEESPEADEQRRRINRRGGYLGFGLGIVMTIVLYLSIRADPYGEASGALPLLAWLSPLAVAFVLLLVPRTRDLAVGFGTGVGISWLVGIPTCVIVTLNTVPVGG